jgi:hypothetical protein
MQGARDRATADRVATLEDERLQSRLCKIKGGNEAIVSAADNDNAIGIRRQEVTSCPR